MQKRETIPDLMRSFVILRDNHTCQMCGKKGEFSLHYHPKILDDKCYTATKTRRAFHIDHIIPVFFGGETKADNLQLLCPKCNLSKGHKLTGVSWI